MLSRRFPTTSPSELARTLALDSTVDLSTTSAIGLSLVVLRLSEPHEWEEVMLRRARDRNANRLGEPSAAVIAEESVVTSQNNKKIVISIPSTRSAC